MHSFMLNHDVRLISRLMIIIQYGKHKEGYSNR
jgi:hypothetical protein